MIFYKLNLNEFHSTGSSPLPVRKATVPDSGVTGIPKKPDELLSSLGHQVDTREIQRITQVRGQFSIISNPPGQFLTKYSS